MSWEDLEHAAQQEPEDANSSGYAAAMANMLTVYHVPRSDEGLKHVVQQALEEAGQGQRGELRIQDFEAALKGADLGDMQVRIHRLCADREQTSSHNDATQHSLRAVRRGHRGGTQEREPGRQPVSSRT